MFTDAFVLAIRPYLTMALGLVGDYMISRGFLQPAQEQAWVEGTVQIISAVGAVTLASIMVYHEFKLYVHKILDNKQVTTVTAGGTTVTTTADASSLPQTLASTSPIPQEPQSVPLWK